jgi:hypothetical protein
MPRLVHIEAATSIAAAGRCDMWRRRRFAAAMGFPRCVAGACLVALIVALGVSCAVAAAGTRYVDGISDQSLPAWDGSFATSPFASFFRARWTPGGGRQIAFGRYVVQWNAMGEASNGPNAGGNYRERFEAWLQDAGSLGLTPVVALTSYDHVYPASPEKYRAALEEILARAAAMGHPIAFVEPWNEPNAQGHVSAGLAAALANSANGLCEGLATCRVIAGDFEDRSTALAYEQEYERSLNFSTGLWGIHPYVSVISHSDVNLLRLIAELPAHGVGDEIWFTEIGALYCSHGVVRGEGRQASDASYLLNVLLRDPAVAPAHVFYYGFLFGGHAPAPCSAGGGDDTELYASTDAPRAAASVILRPASTLVAAGSQPPPSPPPVNPMIEPFPNAIGGVSA